MNTVQDDAVVAGASGTQAVVAAADGRTLTIAECGDPDGFPVFFLHGTPGSRFAGQGFASAYASVGARVVTYDRPGYGGSDRFRGRRVVDCVADISAIADSLGLERFAVTGVSFGGPHSLAVAARLSGRVTRAASVAGSRRSTRPASTGSPAWTRSTSTRSAGHRKVKTSSPVRSGGWRLRGSNA